MFNVKLIHMVMLQVVAVAIFFALIMRPVAVEETEEVHLLLKGIIFIKHSLSVGSLNSLVGCLNADLERSFKSCVFVDVFFSRATEET